MKEKKRSSNLAFYEQPRGHSIGELTGYTSQSDTHMLCTHELDHYSRRAPVSNPFHTTDDMNQKHLVYNIYFYLSQSRIMINKSDVIHMSLFYIALLFRRY